MENKNKKWTARRIIALAGVVLIGVMVISTLLAAIFDKTGTIFRSFLIVTIALPIALWVFLWAYGAMMNKRTIATMDLLLGDEEAVSGDINEKKK